MRILVLTVACGGTKPPDPLPVSPLHADVATFCSEEAATHATALPDLGAFLEPRLHDTEVKTLLFGIRDGTTPLDAFRERLVALAAEAHVAPCPTLDRLFAPRAP